MLLFSLLLLVICGQALLFGAKQGAKVSLAPKQAPKVSASPKQRAKASVAQQASSDEHKCRLWQQSYHVQVGKSWGSLPAKEQREWKEVCSDFNSPSILMVAIIVCRGRAIQSSVAKARRVSSVRNGEMIMAFVLA